MLEKGQEDCFCAKTEEVKGEEGSLWILLIDIEEPQ